MGPLLQFTSWTVIFTNAALLFGIVGIRKYHFVDCNNYECSSLKNNASKVVQNKYNYTNGGEQMLQILYTPE